MENNAHLAFWEGQKQEFEKLLSSGEQWVSSGRGEFEKYLTFVNRNIGEEKKSAK